MEPGEGCGGTSLRPPRAQRGLQESWGGIFIMDCSDRTRGDGLNLKEGRFLSDRQGFLSFTPRAVRPWRRLRCPLPGTAHGQAGWALGSLGWGEAS